MMSLAKIDGCCNPDCYSEWETGCFCCHVVAHQHGVVNPVGSAWPTPQKMVNQRDPLVALPASFLRMMQDRIRELEAERCSIDNAGPMR